MPRAIHSARRAEEIPVGIPRFLPALSATPACRFRGRPKPLDAAGNPPRRSPVLPTTARNEAEATGRGNPGWDSSFSFEKSRFLPILSAAARAKPLDAACNPLGPPRRGISGWDSPFSSRPIHNGGMSLSRGLKPLDTAGNPPRRSPVLPTAARDEAEATGRGNPGWDSLFLIRKGRFLPILSAATRAKPLDAARSPPGPPRRGNSGWDSPFSSYPMRNGGVSLSRGAVAPGCRVQSSQTKSRAADGGTKRSRGGRMRDCFPVFTPRRGFPRFLLILFETVACRFRGGCSPWIPRAILLAEIPCCLRRHGTKQRQRAEGIPVSF